MFRHTYRAWLDETGAPVGVQQKLMRHAHVSTTMDQYGNASALAKRKTDDIRARVDASSPSRSREIKTSKVQREVRLLRLGSEETLVSPAASNRRRR
jgi:hypothetical protein